METRTCSQSLAFTLSTPKTASTRSYVCSSTAASKGWRLRTAPILRRRARSRLVAAIRPEIDDQGGTFQNRDVDSRRTESGAERSVDKQHDIDLAQLDPEEAERVRKKREADALRAAERFMERDEGNYACSSCGYVYTPRTGEAFLGIPPGTRFEDIDERTFQCPVCRSPKSAFQSSTTVVAGFAMNQKYGLGANALTPGQKNALIFGGLFTAFLLLLSGYLLS